MSLQRSPDSLAGFKEAAFAVEKGGAGRDKGEGDVRGSRNHPPYHQFLDRHCFHWAIFSAIETPVSLVCVISVAQSSESCHSVKQMKMSILLYALTCVPFNK